MTPITPLQSLRVLLEDGPHRLGLLAEATMHAQDEREEVHVRPIALITVQRNLGPLAVFDCHLEAFVCVCLNTNKRDIYRDIAPSRSRPIENHINPIPALKQARTAKSTGPRRVELTPMIGRAFCVVCIGQYM